ncbi:Hypothetical predicted protein [Cloeon dipterum]|uniref:Uncharacterized protein n=1 Tax=Cloeon dipterum TaxID=197152 RepID=A0A8S1C607_9INSE|nr:Hypothetical predicted protein [Cloeon dipterum]
MKLKLIFLAVLVALVASFVQAAPAPSDIGDKLSDIAESIVTTESPSIWDRVKTSFSKATDDAKKLADRIQENLGL